MIDKRSGAHNASLNTYTWNTNERQKTVRWSINAGCPYTQQLICIENILRGLRRTLLVEPRILKWSEVEQRKWRCLSNLLTWKGDSSHEKRWAELWTSVRTYIRPNYWTPIWRSRNYFDQWKVIVDNEEIDL